jgi:hypothetical protein
MRPSNAYFDGVLQDAGWRLDSYLATVLGMTRRVTISVPDDVADRLDGIPTRQVSAYVTEALRRRQASDDLRLALHAAGHAEYPFDPEGAIERLSAGRIDHATREAAIFRFAELSGQPVDVIRTGLDVRSVL